MNLKKIISKSLVLAMSIGFMTGISSTSAANAATVTSIPNTTRTIKNYDQSFLSVTGFASVNSAVNDRSSYVGTSYYRTVGNDRQFLQAILDAQSGKVKVIEITSNLNLGWNELGLSSDEAKKYSFISKYENPTNGFTNPNLEKSGASKLNISNTNGLTIFSKNSNIIKHTELKLQSSSKDIIIRNLSFDEMWQWDDAGNHKEVGWTFIKVNGANNVWVDHCNFSIGADGMVDFENGSSGITFSWCNFGLAANENPASDSAIYASINYMENKYKNNQLNSNSRYYKLRSNGASAKQIMAFAAYHSKCHLVGSGDKDFTNYVDSNGKNYYDGNQRLQLTMAYCRYTNVGQRVPMIRQGVGHMFNCYIDDSTHASSINNVSAIKNYGGDNLFRAMNARNGASIGADTCVYNGVTQPMVGTELQGDDTSNMNAPWDSMFKNAYNNSLIVNSKITNSNGTYTGSSWDNNGSNLFTTGYTWHDKSTIGKWAWSSSINGVENMSKSNPPSTPFTFTYNYNEKLPYAYNVVPLDNVVSTLNSYCGAGKVSMSASDWLKTSYSSGSSSNGSNNNNNNNNNPTSTPVTTISNGSYYRIKNVNSGKYLAVTSNDSGTQAIQTSNLSDSSIWQVIGSSDAGYIQLSPMAGDGMKVMDVAGGSSENNAVIQIWGNGHSNNQKFKLKDNGDGSFGILTKASGDSKGLDVTARSKEEGAKVIQYNYAASTNQKWIFEKVSSYSHPIVNNGTYYIKNLNSQLYLDVLNGVDSNGTNVRQWTGNGASAQRFKIVSTGDGYYKFVSQVGAAARVLDVSGNSAADGQSICIFEDRGTDNQKFKLIPLGDDRYQIATKISGDKSLVEVKNAEKNAGADVQQWTNNSNNCQKWVLEVIR